MLIDVLLQGGNHPAQQQNPGPFHAVAHPEAQQHIEGVKAHIPPHVLHLAGHGIVHSRGHSRRQADLHQSVEGRQQEIQGQVSFSLSEIGKKQPQGALTLVHLVPLFLARVPHTDTV